MHFSMLCTTRWKHNLMCQGSVKCLSSKLLFTTRRWNVYSDTSNYCSSSFKCLITEGPVAAAFVSLIPAKIRKEASYETSTRLCEKPSGTCEKFPESCNAVGIHQRCGHTKDSASADPSATPSPCGCTRTVVSVSPRLVVCRRLNGAPVFTWSGEDTMIDCLYLLPRQLAHEERHQLYEAFYQNETGSVTLSANLWCVCVNLWLWRLKRWFDVISVR